ncbi:MAG: adenosine-specific kinase [Candidatus Sericytochromatia bacterium]
MNVELKAVSIEKPEDVNVIIGQSHFIKTVEDLYEVCMNVSPNIKFGLAFAEASGECLIRADGNDAELRQLAIHNLHLIGASHSFLVALREAFPINVLNAIKMVPEVCNIFAASANPLQVLVAETEQGRGIIGVIDGYPPRGVEATSDADARNRFLRNLGYKR